MVPMYLSLLAAIAGCVPVDPTPQDSPVNQTAAAADYKMPPFRVQFGGFASHVSQGYGTWRGVDGQVWFRGNRYFVPAFLMESQTRPQGTQQNYSFFSYANWSKSFYTTQSFSAAPQRDPQAIYFPKRRYDIKANWKLPPEQHFVVGAGYTRFDMGAAGHGQIFNVGSLYYRGKFVLEGNLFLNRVQPGDLYSASGLLSAQYGREGHSWWGITAGGGREIYQLTGQTPFEVRFASYSLTSFYRRWVTRNMGFVVSLDYLDKLTAYRKAGGTVSLFFEF